MKRVTHATLSLDDLEALLANELGNQELLFCCDWAYLCGINEVIC